MSPALFGLVARQIRGRVVRWLRMIKNPRYLIGILGFAGWMSLWLLGFARPGGGSRGMSIQIANIPELDPQAMEGLVAAAAFALGTILTLWWLIPWSRPALKLNEPELSLLLPAPVTRRRVLQYSLMKEQPAIVIGAAILTFVFASGGPAERLARFVFVWIALTGWNLHEKARQLWILRQRQGPRPAAWRRRALLSAILLAAWITVAVTIPAIVTSATAAATAPGIEGLALASEFLKSIESSTGSIWVWRILDPVRLLLRPALLGWLAAGWASWLALGVVLLGHHEWVVRSKTHFEESALEHSRRATLALTPGAKLRRLGSRARSRQVFRLEPRGWPEVAIFWKNLMKLVRWPLSRLLTIGLTVLAVTSLVLGLADPPVAVWGLIVIGGSVLSVFFPLLSGSRWRNDFRSDFNFLETLRSWPLHPWRLVLAETLAPAALAMACASFGLGLVLAVEYARQIAEARGGIERFFFAPPELSSALGVSQVVLPVFLAVSIWPVLASLSILSSSIQNLFALLFPAWFAGTVGARGGAAQFGQRIIFGFMLMLALVLGILPGALVVGILLAAHWLSGLAVVAWELPLWGLLAAVPLLLEISAIVYFGSQIWTSIDPAQEMLDPQG